MVEYYTVENHVLNLNADEFKTLTDALRFVCINSKAWTTKEEKLLSKLGGF